MLKKAVIYFSLAFGVIAFFSAIRSSSAPCVAFLHIEGCIGKGLPVNEDTIPVAAAFGPRNLKAVFLIINSPGGSPVQSEAVASKITRLAKSRKVPVYSFVRDCAASGGYWIACAGDKIFAFSNSIVGSIGVVNSSFGYVDLMKKIGVERRLHTKGENKVIMDEYSPLDPGKMKILDEVLTGMHKSFISHVVSRRGDRLKKDQNLFDGRFWRAEDALPLGLVDGISDFDSVLVDLESELKTKLVIHHFSPKEKHWLRKLISSSIQAFLLESSLYSNLGFWW